MALAFLLDEHLRGPLWHAIQRHNLVGDLPVNVVRVGDSPDVPLGIGDPAILTWAEHEHRILVTLDRHTMVAHMLDHLAAGNSSPGVLIVRSRVKQSDLLECLVLVAHCGDPDEFRDAVTFIP